MLDLPLPEEHVQRVADVLESARLSVLNRAAGDYPWFIRNFCRIEIKESVGLIDAFKLWPFQLEALRVIGAGDVVVVLKARQLGLSWLVIADTACRMLFEPGYRVSAISKSDFESMEMARRLRVILENIPEWIIRPHSKQNKDWGGPTWEANTDRVVIHFPRQLGQISRADSILHALPQNPESARSLTGHRLILDEFAFQQHASNIWTGALPTINDGTGQVVVISTGRRGTKFEELVQQAKDPENGFALLFFPWHVRPDRNEAWYDKVKRKDPNNYRAEYPATEEEAFSVGQGAFFPEYDDRIHIHVGYVPPTWWRRQGAYDPGYTSRACFKWYAIEPDGKYAVCYREYYPQRVTDAVQAEEVLRLSAYPDGTAEALEVVWTDREAWNASSESGQSTAEIFLERGIPLVPAAKSKMALRNGWRRLHAFLLPRSESREGAGTEEGAPPVQNGLWSLLSFTNECAHTRRTYPACEQSSTDPEDIARTSEHHCQDCDRMFCYAYPLELPGVPSGVWDATWGKDPETREQTEAKLPWALQDERVEEPDDF